jgi:hypothetical protein
LVKIGLTDLPKSEVAVLASYNNLRIGQDYEILTPGVDNVKIEHALTFSMTKKVFS